MAEDLKRKLRFVTFIYWVLLFYIIAALVWWFLSLEKQNEAMYHMRIEQLALTHQNNTGQKDALHKIEEQRRVNIAKYVGEGSTFLLLILVGAVFVYRSVRRQLQLQQQQQNFVMAITHELKTPLAVARLNLETLQKHSLDEAMQNKLVATTLQETLRLDTLINNILIASQLEGNSYRLSRQSLNLEALAAQSVQEFSARYPSRTIHTELQKGIFFTGDDLLLRLLLSNLLENAHKYAPKNTAINLTLKQDAAHIKISVVDAGPGIADVEKNNIFQKFYRIGNEHTRTAKGTGLGLYICKKIVQDHGGQIHVSDNHPQGSNFMVDLPINHLNEPTV